MLRLALTLAAFALVAPAAADAAITTERDSVPVPQEQGPTATATATCPAGTNVVSGGWQTTAAVIGILESRRVGKRSWRVTASRFTNDLAPSTLTTYAYCDSRAKRLTVKSAELRTNAELAPTGAKLRCPRGKRAISGGFRLGSTIANGTMIASFRGKQRTWRAKWHPFTDSMDGQALAYCGEGKRTRKRGATKPAGPDREVKVRSPRCAGNRSGGFRATTFPTENPLAVTTFKRKGRRWVADGHDPDEAGHSLTVFAYCPRR
jgi:hypothetical protein